MRDPQDGEHPDKYDRVAPVLEHLPSVAISRAAPRSRSESRLIGHTCGHQLNLRQLPEIGAANSRPGICKSVTIRA